MKTTTIITASIHVSPESDVSVCVEQLKTNSNKYAVLSIGDATIFINSREKALEISNLLEKAAQKWDEEGVSTNFLKAEEIESLLDELHELSRWGVRRGAYCKNDVNNLVFELNNIIDQLEALEFEEDKE